MNIPNIIALILLPAFYIIYSGKMLALRKRNIRANILGKGEKPRNSIVAEIVLRFVTVVCVPVQFFSVIFDGVVYSIPSFPFMCGFGLIMMFAGTVIFLSAILAMRDNWRAGYNSEQDTQLVTEGIYGFSRNPAFVGFDLLYIGCALAFPNVINIIFATAGAVLFHIQILGEERFLEGMFGNAYRDYKAKVRRYI